MTCPSFCSDPELRASTKVTLIYRQPSAKPPVKPKPTPTPAPVPTPSLPKGEVTLGVLAFIGGVGAMYILSHILHKAR